MWASTSLQSPPAPVMKAQLSYVAAGDGVSDNQANSLSDVSLATPEPCLFGTSLSRRWVTSTSSSLS